MNIEYDKISIGRVMMMVWRYRFIKPNHLWWLSLPQARRLLHQMVKDGWITKGTRTYHL